eukprot:TRINITY_DN881_c0_g1_i6.p1 TRINITY_DN881_c0_g1~~TRINITY_DN881_c0_g1_i6.p1  ORF type:complete len:382 (-),score=58.66 TRINITY_DN881_c0_g1_i6:13-1158(-)
MPPRSPDLGPKPWQATRRQQAQIDRIAVTEDSLHLCLSHLALMDMAAYTRARLSCKPWSEATHVERLPLPDGGGELVAPRNTALKAHRDVMVPDEALDQLTTQWRRSPREPGIHTVTLAHCTALTNIGVRSLTQLAPQLRQLDLSHCVHLTADGLLPVLQACEGISSLSCFGCTALLVDDQLDAITALCGLRLESLDIGLPAGQHAGLTEATAEYLVERCPLLNTLGLVRQHKVSVQSLGRLQALEAVETSGCDWSRPVGAPEGQLLNWSLMKTVNASAAFGFKNEELVECTAAMPELQTLQLSRCQNITDAAVCALPLQCKGLSRLELAWLPRGCLLYTSDAADEEDSVDLGGRRIIKKKKKYKNEEGAISKLKMEGEVR